MATADYHLIDALSAAKGVSVANARELDGVAPAALKEFARVLLWKLYDAEQGQTLFTLNLWVIKKTFTVADLAPLLTRWVGAHP